MARSAPSRPAPPDARPARGWLPGLLAGALAVRLVVAVGSSGLTMDSPLYVRMAEALRAGAHAPSPAHHGYPLLIAALSWLVPGREWPARALSLVASLAVVALVHTLARRRLGPRAALFAGGAAALHPLLAVYGSAIMTEATFLALALAGVACLDARRPVVGGALLGLGWWVRPEAVVVAPLATLLTPLGPRGRALALAAALAVALPYTAFLRVQQGHWSLTPKTVLVHAPAPSGRAAEWRLADSTAFADTVGLRERLARDGRAILAAYPSRLLAHLRALGVVWGLPWIALALVGLTRREGRGPWLAFAALPLVHPLFDAPPDPRFAQLSLPALLVPLAAGVRAGTERGGAGRALALAAWLGGVGLLWAGPAGHTARAFDDGPMAAMRGAGTWIAAHSPPDAVVMDRKSYVAFFAGRRHVQLPDESLDGVLDHARASGAAYVVVEEYVVRALRPQLAPLLDARVLAREPRVRLVFATRPAPGDGVVVLEVAR